MLLYCFCDIYHLTEFSGVYTIKLDKANWSNVNN